jgi:hypothetical protein
MEHFSELFGENCDRVIAELQKRNELKKVLELFHECEQIAFEEEEWLINFRALFRKKLAAGFGYSPMQGLLILILNSVAHSKKFDDSHTWKISFLNEAGPMLLLQKVCLALLTVS